MKMELTHPQLPNDWEGYPKKVFDILNQTLQLPDDPKSVGAKLAQDVISMDENGKYLEPVLETIWEVILIIVRYIPPGYPWQESLFELVSILRRREGQCKQDDRKYITREVSHHPRPIAGQGSSNVCRRLYGRIFQDFIGKLVTYGTQVMYIMPIP
jgi:hypothetical protein